MTDAELRVLEIKRDFESAGCKWTAPATNGQLLTVAQTLIDDLGAATQRIATLEKRIEGMQVNVDHATKHALRFSGEFQPALSYQPGALVGHKGGVFVAMKEVPPARGEPNRQGSAWARLV